MKLSEERKQQILASLKEDYVPFSDVFHEICADTVADMLMVGALSTEEGRYDKNKLNRLKHSYFNLVPEQYTKVIPVIEEALSLQAKYQTLRFG